MPHGRPDFAGVSTGVPKPETDTGRLHVGQALRAFGEQRRQSVRECGEPVQL